MIYYTLYYIEIYKRERISFIFYHITATQINIIQYNTLLFRYA